MVCFYRFSLKINTLLINGGAGNGTQSIVWQINEETYRKVLEQKDGGPPSSPGPQIYYGSTHDVLSYPCEVISSNTSNDEVTHDVLGWET